MTNDIDATRNRSWSRESRLLLLTILVCAAALLALARLRFPERPAVDTTAQPLERLAARASYDSLAADAQAAEAKVRDHVVVLRLAGQAPGDARDLRDLLSAPEPALVTYAVVLRIAGRDGVAIVAPGARTRAEVVGESGAGARDADLVAADPLRRLARVRLAPASAPASEVRPLPLSALATPAYVLAVEATPAGASFRPVFIGRGDRFRSPRWERPLLPIGGAPLAAGTLLFSFDGQFIGVSVMEQRAAAIVGAADLLQAATRLSGDAPAPGWAGITVQPLSARLAAATGAPSGVAVADVDAAGPASGVLQPADVITALEGRPVDDPDDLLLRIAERAPGDTVAFDLVRSGKPARGSVTLTSGEDASREEGLDLVRAPGGGTRVVAGGRLHLEGLVAGDLIVRAGDTALPTPAQLRRALSRAGTPFTILAVRRVGRTRLVAVPPPALPARDAAR